MPEQSSGIEQFEGANVQVAVHVPDKVLSVGEEFEVRIDLINTGREAANLHFVDNIPKLFSFQERHEKDSSLAIVKEPLSVVELKGKSLKPLQVESLSLLAKIPDMIIQNLNKTSLSPRVCFSDQKGKLRYSNPITPVKVNIETRPEFRFETENAKRLFDYLVDAYIEDYGTKKINPEKAGWRSLFEIAQEMHIPISTTYSKSRTSGAEPALVELEKSGLIETRIFSGLRGRGGEARRVRIRYDKESLRSYVGLREKAKV